jgi:hypothetical protein
VKLFEVFFIAQAMIDVIRSKHKPSRLELHPSKCHSAMGIIDEARNPEAANSRDHHFIVV